MNSKKLKPAISIFLNICYYLKAKGINSRIALLAIIIPNKKISVDLKLIIKFILKQNKYQLVNI